MGFEKGDRRDDMRTAFSGESSAPDLSASTADLYFDPYDYEIDANPHPIWKRMRDEAPLYRNDKYDFYALSRFDDVLAASLDTETYSSARGTVLEMISDEPIPGGSPMMIWLDPPEHTRLRKLVSRAFSPRRIAALEEEIRHIAVAISSHSSAARGFDYVADFGAKLPMMVIGAMLGVPEEDRDAYPHLDRRDAAPRAGRDRRERAPRQRAPRALGLLRAATCRSGERDPKDDMMTDLIEAEIVDASGAVRRLDDGELHRLHRPAVGRGKRDRRAATRLGRHDARELSRRTTEAGRRSEHDPERGRGAAALRGALAGAGPLRHARQSSGTAGSFRRARRWCC